MAWRGLIGKAFKTPAEFSAYVDVMSFSVWRPRFVVVHNTSAPDLKTYQKWHDRGSPSDEQWMQNLQGYYRDQQHWSSGPHLFVTPKSICVFSPLTGPGTHTPSWNSISWGVETVGEYEIEPFDGAVRDNLVAALAILHVKAGLQPLPFQVGVRGLHFHKEDVRTTHKTCPGKHINKSDLVSRVQAYISNLSLGDHHPILTDENMGKDDHDPPILRRGDFGNDVAEMQALMVKSDMKVVVDGDFGPRTENALRLFQLDRNLIADAICGPQTWAALKK